jgi:hypothetical protein
MLILHEGGGAVDGVGGLRPARVVLVLLIGFKEFGGGGGGVWFIEKLWSILHNVYLMIHGRRLSEDLLRVFIRCGYILLKSFLQW